VLFSGVIAAVNLLFPSVPGFFGAPVNPYLLLALVVAAYYGKYYALLSLGTSSLLVCLPLPLALQRLHPASWSPSYWRTLLEAAPVPVAATALCACLIGLIHDVRAGAFRGVRERMRRFARDKGELRRQKRALLLVNQELEQRIFGQRDILPVLYSAVQRLFSLDLREALQAILSAMERFAGASRASVWELDRESGVLRLSAALGWEGEPSRPNPIPLDRSIPGWVARNNQPYSLRMLTEHDHLRRLDTGHSLMCFPLLVGERIWGALEIEEMPLARYNLHTERVIAALLSMAAPALQRAAEYEAVLEQGEPHPLTGLPSFPQLHSLLGAALHRARRGGGTLSVLVLELTNFGALSDRLGLEAVSRLVGMLARELLMLSRNQARVFHYRNANQIAVLYPGLDHDGASLFSLEALGLLSRKDWGLGDPPVRLEVLLGFASLSDTEGEAEQLLRRAEQVLQVQRA
jgi:GGDEF domain-containing protein